MNLIKQKTDHPDVHLFTPKKYDDGRGSFFESYNEKDFFTNLNSEVHFVQDNQSESIKNVLRGLHYQIKFSQAKLIRVLEGSIIDVAVDLRKHSKYFGKSVSIELTEQNRKQLYIPIGFAHGYIVKSNLAKVQYKASDYWHPEYERTIIWNDPTLSIDWGEYIKPILSEKDKNGVSLRNAETYE